MYRCEAPNCKMRTYNLSKEQLKLAKNNYIVSFHKFPDDSDKRKAWIDAACKDDWNPPKFSNLCSLHFRDDCFNDNNELYDHAIPTIFFDDFRSHIRGIVRDFDLQCGFSDDEEDGEESASEKDSAESTTDNNQIKSSSDVDEDDVSIVECEEIMEYEDEEEDDVGIENIPITESLGNTNSTVTKSIHKSPTPPPPSPETLTVSDLELMLSSPVTATVPQPPPAPVEVLKQVPAAPVSQPESISVPKSSPLAPESLALPQAEHVPVPTTKPEPPLVTAAKAAVISKPTTALISTSNTPSICTTAPVSTSSVTKPVSFPQPVPSISDKESMIIYKPKTTPVFAPELSSLSLPKSVSAPISKPQPVVSVPESGPSKKVIKKVILHTTPTLQKITDNVTVSINNKPRLQNVTKTTPVTKAVNRAANDADDDDVICLDDLEPPDTSQSAVSTPSSKSASNDATKSEESTKHLFSLLKPASLNKYLIEEPASRNLVMQLLNIVKLANIPNENKGLNNLPSTFIITTKIEDKNDTKQVIRTMESTAVIQTVTSLLKHYKAGRFPKLRSTSLICGSPAIFFMKYVSVKNCDPDMNSIYIITNENLLPVLFQYRVKDRLKYQKKSNETKPTTAGLKQRSNLDQMTNTAIESEASMGFQDNASASDSTSNPVSSSPFVKAALQLTNSRPQLSTASTSNSTSLLKMPKFQSSTTLSSTTSTNVTSKRNANFGTVSKSPYAVSKPPTSVAPVARVIPSSFTSPVSSRSPRYQAPVTKTISSPVSTSAFSKPRPYGISEPTLPRFSENRLAIDNEPIPSTSFVDTTCIPDKSKSRPSISSVVKDFFVSTGFPSSLEDSTRKSIPNECTFKPIRADTFNTGFTQSPSSVLSCSPIPSTSKATSALLKRPWPQEYHDNDDDDNDDDDDIIVVNSPRHDIDKQEYAYEQQKEIEVLEHSILQKEREIDNLKKKCQILQQRLNDVCNSQDNKTDDQLIEDVLSKYIDADGVQFFIGQMKVAGKTYTQFRWSEEDKLFALGLLYKNPVEYNILFQKYTLPSDKTLNKFVTRIKKAEASDAKDAE